MKHYCTVKADKRALQHQATVITGSKDYEDTYHNE